MHRSLRQRVHGRWKAACAGLLLSVGSATAGPRLQVSDAVWDFGSVTNVQEIAHDFLLRNEGDTPLEIIRVNSGCDSCLTAAVEKKTIPPGDVGLLRCRADLRHHTGAFTRNLTLFSNDSDQPTFAFSVTGMVVPLFEVTPPEVSVDLGSGQRNGVAQILPLLRLHAPLSRVQLDNTNMIAQISRPSAGGYTLTVQPLPTLPRGRTKFQARVQSADSRDPSCLVGGIVYNPSDLEIVPPALHLQPKAGVQSRIVWLRQRGMGPMTLVDLVVPSGNMRATVEPDASGYNYRIDILAWEQQRAAGSTNQLLLKMRDQFNHDNLVPVPVVVRPTDSSNP